MDGWWRFGVGVAATVAVLVGMLAFWPEADGPRSLESGPRSPTTASAAPPAPFGEAGTGGGGQVDTDVDLFVAGAPEAVIEVLAAAGGPQQLMDIAIYPTYLFVAYVDPARPEHIDRRAWRAGIVDEAAPNPIDDRVDADTQPALFGPDEIDLAPLPGVVADARGRYGVPVEVTHVLIDRFLPFDERVLVRVYARPSDGRSGGGYVTYLPDGTFVRVCC